VEVELVQEASTLHVAVNDSGDGVRPDFIDEVFTEGASTRSGRGMPGGGRGIGLALSRQIARTLGGDVTLTLAQSSVASLGGAEFMARLPGAMVEEESLWVT
jgi:two-component system CitB family sensor kinase